MLNMKPIIKLLIPPILWPVVFRLKRTFHTHTLRLKRTFHTHTYPTFAAAAADCGAGYANTELTRITLEKTLIARQKELPDISWTQGAAIYIGLTYAAALLPSRPLRVLDFGGSFGFHGMICADALPDIATRWAVVESPEVATMARPIESDRLRVFTGIDQALDWLGGIDVMHSSGTVQYLSDPDGTVRSLVNLGAPVMLWQRMMFANGPRTHAVQTVRLSGNHNGLGDFLPEGFTDHLVRIPITYITEAELRSACTGYRLAIRIPPFCNNWNQGLATFGTVLLFVRSTQGNV
jgi:putative methyltransferase (TIGR04325 family)